MEFPSAFKKYRVWIAGALVLALLSWFLLGGSGAPTDPDPAIARINKLEKAKDVKGLTAALGDPNTRAACAAAAALAHVGNRDSQGALQAVLKEPRPQLRDAAALALASTADAGNVGPLAEVLKTDSVAPVRVTAAKALMLLNAWDATQPLLDALSDKDPDVRQAAKLGLERYCGLRFPGFQAGSPDEAARKRAIDNIRGLLPRAKVAHDQFQAAKKG